MRAYNVTFLSSRNTVGARLGCRFDQLGLGPLDTSQIAGRVAQKCGNGAKPRREAAIAWSPGRATPSELVVRTGSRPPAIIFLQATVSVFLTPVFNSAEGHLDRLLGGVVTRRSFTYFAASVLPSAW